MRDHAITHQIGLSGPILVTTVPPDWPKRVAAHQQHARASPSGLSSSHSPQLTAQFPEMQQ
jgi:hypothetical protein